MGVAHDNNFEKLAEQFTKFLCKRDPVEATYIGVHEFDEAFADYSPSGLKSYKQKLDSYKKSFKEINKRTLNDDNSVDYQLALGLIETRLMYLNKVPLHEILPDIYLKEILFGIYILVTRDFAPVRERALSATRRLAQVPNQLKNATKHLKNPPKIYVQSAIKTCDGAISFFQETIPDFALQIRGALQEALIEVNDDAIAELTKFKMHLEEKLLDNAKDNFAIGKVAFNQLLKNAHHLPYTHDKLIKLAKKEMKAIEKELVDTAAKIDKKKTWQQIVDELKKAHPSTQGLLGAYKKEMKRALSFVTSNDLVTVPEGQEIEVVPTPQFAKPVIPYAAYLSPAPLEENQKGTFWVTVPTGLSAKEAKERLKGHSKWGIAVTALHEAYPGHHLQLVRSNEKDSIIRHLTHSTVFAEGWAFYCEEMMWEQGFYSDPKERLLQLKDALWRACRVLIDVGLHTKTMKTSEAIEMLVEKAGLEKPNAEVEVNRYCQTPTQPMSYLIGKIELMSLFSAYRKKNKKASLKQFHDELLSHGTIPISHVSTLMGL